MKNLVLVLFALTFFSFSSAQSPLVDFKSFLEQKGATTSSDTTSLEVGGVLYVQYGDSTLYIDYGENEFEHFRLLTDGNVKVSQKLRAPIKIAFRFLGVKINLVKPFSVNEEIVSVKRFNESLDAKKLLINKRSKKEKKKKRKKHIL